MSEIPRRTIEELVARYACRIQPLNVVPSPILPHNPNHADVIGYPPRKDEQLSLAASARSR